MTAAKAILACLLLFPLPARGGGGIVPRIVRPSAPRAGHAPEAATRVPAPRLTVPANAAAPGLHAGPPRLPHAAAAPASPARRPSAREAPLAAQARALAAGPGVQPRLAALYDGAERGIASRAVDAAAADGSASFRRALRARETGQPLPRKARRYKYLLVRGLLWDEVPGYLLPHAERLRALGLDAELVDTDPAGPEAANAESVRRAVLAADKPVILIGHSKGALDALAALERHPQLQRKVSRLVALQSPYFGTELGDAILFGAPLDESGRAYVRAFHEAYLRAPLLLWPAIHGLSRRARGGLPPKRPALRRGLRLYSIVTRRTGEPGDGVVRAEHGVIPGSSAAELEGPDHVDTVIGTRAPGGGRVARYAADLGETIVRWIMRRRPPPRARVMEGS